MAFCVIEKQHRETFQLLVNQRINKDKESLKNFKEFSKDIFTFLVSKGQSVERAIALVRFLPQAVSDYSNILDNRKALRTAGVSMDAIADVEDQFKEYGSLAKYLGIKNESTPLVVVNDNQLAQEAKITKHILDTKVEFVGDNRIVNGKKYDLRVTTIAKVGFDDAFDLEAPQSPALKHGNTVDTIAKAIFDDIIPRQSDFAELIDPQAFDALVGQLRDLKSSMQEQGYIFKTGVTVYNKKLGLSGEIDLVAVTPEGQAYILDFKTANQRFNEPYLKTEVLSYKSDNIRRDVTILSKWKQYGTQGYIYGQMISDQLDITPVPRVGIIGINISYDATVPVEDSKIEKVVEIQVHNIPFSEIRTEFKDKNTEQIVNEYNLLEGKELGAITEIKPLTRRSNRRKFDDIGPEKPLERIRRINEIAASDEELQKEINWFKGSPLGRDTVLRISDMVNTGLFGQFTLDGITIFKNASKGTVYHEGWHRFSQVFMSPAQKDELYENVKKDAIRFTTRDGRRINTSDASYLDVEEYLAEQFAKYALDPENYVYPRDNAKPKGLFQRIWAFLKRFFGSNPHPIEVFQKLYTGKIGEYIPSVNNSYWGNLNSIVENSNGEEIISNERFPLYVRSFDFLVGDQLKKYKRSFTAFKQSKRLQSQVMANVFAVLNDRLEDPNLTDQQAEELTSILTPQNRFNFVKAYLSASSYDTLKDFSIDEEVFTMTTEELSAMEDLREAYNDVEDIDESPEEDSKPERFDRTGNEDSAFSVADDAIQDFFRTIPKVKSVNKDGSFVYEINELGFPENHKYYDIFYKTKRILSGSFDMQEMLDRMDNKNNQRIFPELGIVNNFIKEFINNPEEKNFYRAIQNLQFTQSFYMVMSMPEVPNMQLTINYLPITRPYLTFQPTMVAYRTASRNLALKIVKTWEKNFKDRRNKEFTSYDNFEQDKAKIAKSPLFLTSDGKILLNPSADFQTFYPNTIKGIRDFWEIMGVTFNPKVFEDPESINRLREYKAILLKNIGIFKNYSQYQFMADAEDVLSRDQIATDSITDLNGYILAMPDIVMDELAKIWFINNPVSFFNEKREYDTLSIINGKEINAKQTTDPMKFLFEDLAAIEEKFGDRVSSGSFRIEDKTKYPYYIPNQLLIVTELLNKVQRTNQFQEQFYLKNLDPTINKWMRRSYFFTKLFDQNGNRLLDSTGKPIRIVVEDIASVRTITEESILEKHPRSLTRDEKFFMDLLTMFKAGAIEIPRAETSSTMFSIRLSDYGRGKIMPFTLQESLGKAVPESFHQVIKDYFAAEIEKRQWFIQNDPEVKGANKIPLAEQFNIFEGILSPELRAKVEKYLASMSANEIFEQENILSDFRTEVEDYFVQLTADIRPRFDALSPDQKTILKDTLGAKNLQNWGSAAKTFVLNHFVLSQEFYNLYFGDLYYYKNAFKRGKYVTNTGNTFFIDDYRNQLLNGIQSSTLNSIYTGKKPGGKDFRYINTAIAEDVEMRSAYTHQDDNTNILLNDILNMRVASGTLFPNTIEYAEARKEIKGSLAKYEKINIADGQGVIGMDFYRNFSIITNIWSEEKEKEYERQKAIFRRNFNLYFKLVDGARTPLEADELEEAKKSDDELITAKAHAYFNPLKISYTGPQVKDGPLRPVFDKFSVRPIIPEAAIGKRDESMLLEMVKKDIDYIKFKSGTKVYQDSVFNWFNKIGDGEYDLNDYTTEEIEPNQLYAGFLKHQLSTEGIKEENILGSQFRKIVFGIKYSPLVRNNPSLVTKFTNLERKFHDNIKSLIEVEQGDLFSLLGVQEDRGSYRVSDMKKFLRLLTNESIKRGVAINNIDYIQYDEMTKNAKYPIDYAFNRQSIQDLISGLIDDRLRRLKVNGSSLIQVSSAGFENKQKFTNATREDILKYGTTGLHYYHINYDGEGNPINTSTMGVKVALTKDYEKLLNLQAPESLGVSRRVSLTKGTELVPNKIGTLERLNEAMKDTEWKAKHMDKFILIGYRIPTQNNNFIDRMEVMEFLPSSAGAVIIPPIELIVKSGSDFDIDKMNVIKPSFGGNGAIISPPKESLSDIRQAIDNLTFEERDAKYAKKQLEQVLQNTYIDLDVLETLQRKIRFTLLDLAMKSNVSDDIIDKIAANISNLGRNVVPIGGKEDLEAFTEEDIRQWSEVETEAMAQLAQVDAQIQRLEVRYEKASEENKRMKDKDMEWFNKKRTYKRAMNNQMLDILSETLAHPYYFELLITPSSASTFEGWTNELMASEANMTEGEFAEAMEESEGKLFDATRTAQESSTYDASSESFDNLLSKRKDLGGYAIQRTFADIFNFVKFSIAKSYTVQRGKEDITKVLHTPLIAPADRSKSLENGRLLMYGDSVTGVPIKNSFDELISLTVDLAGSPAYPNMGINNYNKKQVQYLLHQKTDPKQVMWFMNQPVLKDLYALYEDKRRKMAGYTLKHAIAELSLRLRILENPNRFQNSSIKMYEVMDSKRIPPQYDEWSEELIEGTGVRVPNPKKANIFLTKPYTDLHLQNLTDVDYFSFDAMDRAIRGEDAESAEYKDLQKKVLAYFGSITEEADWLMKLQFSNNVDTTTYATLTSLIRNENNRRDIRIKTDLFSKDQLDSIEKESMIAPFDYTQKAKSILKALFPKLYTNNTIFTFSKLVNNVWGAKNVQIERISKIVENDYIEYIYKNYGTYRGKNLSEYFEPALINQDAAQDHEYYSYKVLQLLSEYPELREIPFVGALYEDVYNPPLKVIEDSYKGLDNKEIHNIFFLRNPDNPTFEKNVFTNNWRNLINFDPERLGLENVYSAEDISKISNLFHEMVYFSLYQSGLTNTGNGFSDLIPYEYWAQFIQQSFDAYDEAKEKNSNLETEMLREFEVRFKQMNPKINWRTKYRLIDEYDEEGRPLKVELDFFKNYYRGKDYRVTDDDLGFARDIFLYDEDELADLNEPKPEPTRAESKFEIGRYVDYNGDIYIITKPLSRKDVWQIYNPLKEGAAAKLSVSVKNMSARPEMGSIVQFGQKQYLVTAKQEIIDLDSNKKVTWRKEDPNRKKIIDLARQQRPPSPPEDGVGPAGAPQIAPRCP